MSQHNSPTNICAGMETFASPALAHEVGRRRSSRGKGGKVYRCAVCNGWHIGSDLRPQPVKPFRFRKG